MPSCADCQAWLYDIKTGEWTEGRDGKRVPRLNLPTPCESCPRKAPQFEADTTLSEQNWKAYGLFLEVRAMTAVCLSDRQRRDPLTRRVLAIADSIVRDHQHGEVIQAIQLSQLAMLQR